MDSKRIQKAEQAKKLPNSNFSSQKKKVTLNQVEKKNGIGQAVEGFYDWFDSVGEDSEHPAHNAQKAFTFGAEYGAKMGEGVGDVVYHLAGNLPSTIASSVAVATVCSLFPPAVPVFLTGVTAYSGKTFIDGVSDTVLHLNNGDRERALESGKQVGQSTFGLVAGLSGVKLHKANITPRGNAFSETKFAVTETTRDVGRSLQSAYTNIKKTPEIMAKVFENRPRHFKEIPEKINQLQSAFTLPSRELTLVNAKNPTAAKNIEAGLKESNSKVFSEAPLPKGKGLKVMVKKGHHKVKQVLHKHREESTEVIQLFNAKGDPLIKLPRGRDGKAKDISDLSSKELLESKFTRGPDKGKTVQQVAKGRPVRVYRSTETSNLMVNTEELNTVALALQKSFNLKEGQVKNLIKRWPVVDGKTNLLGSQQSKTIGFLAEHLAKGSPKFKGRASGNAKITNRTRKAKQKKAALKEAEKRYTQTLSETLPDRVVSLDGTVTFRHIGGHHHEELGEIFEKGLGNTSVKNPNKIADFTSASLKAKYKNPADSAEALATARSHIKSSGIEKKELTHLIHYAEGALISTGLHSSASAKKGRDKAP